jgi:prepilin-type N-terminal cleavage/methylation domain-containing protein
MTNSAIGAGLRHTGLEAASRPKRAETGERMSADLQSERMIKRQLPKPERGMSIVELMVVVVIIGILAAIAQVAYTRYIARARTSEATAMLAEFAAKEQLYFLDNGQYAEAHKSAAVYPSVNEDASDFFPSNPGIAPFDSVRNPVVLGALPASWRTLGIRPRWQALYCTYLANAGAAGSALPSSPSPAVGPTLWPASPNVPWFYAIAVCNLLKGPGWPNRPGQITVTSMVLTQDSPSIRTVDETE